MPAHFIPRRLLVTGGAGFIGSNFIRFLQTSPEVERPDIVLNFDKLTYAGNRANLEDFEGESRYLFHKGDILNREEMQRVLERHEIEAIVHFAAESHVDRSIDNPGAFMETNVHGTFQLLEAALDYTRKDPERSFRFLHVSTDEVYGSLGPDDPAFTESTPSEPNSPYAASKAASDHLVRAWHHTYGLPTVTTNCSNNYGPYQFPEKLIPLMVLNACEQKPLPLYGDGKNVRDWLYVEDHCRGIWAALSRGRLGETYNIGGRCEKTNLEIVETICAILDRKRPRPDGRSHKDLIIFVKDRPGHDWRYAIDFSKIETELGWEPKETFETGLEKTVDWYLGHEEWRRQIEAEKYRRQRLGTR